MKAKTRLRRPNTAARTLADPKFRARVVKAKKGKGSYSRKGRQVHPDALSLCLVPGRAYAPISSIREARVTVARFWPKARSALLSIN